MSCAIPSAVGQAGRDQSPQPCSSYSPGHYRENDTLAATVPVSSSPLSSNDDLGEGILPERQPLPDENENSYDLFKTSRHDHNKITKTHHFPIRSLTTIKRVLPSLKRTDNN